MTVTIVVAHSRNRVIGRDGGLPWHLPSDLRWFRELTTGHAVLMGRTTYASLPDPYRPLPGRRNLVLSSRPDAAPGAEVFADLPSALEACDHDCFVIGGGRTYAEALPVADRVWATEIDAEIDGDTVFPPLPEREWRLAEERPQVVENDYAFALRRYDRVA